MRSGWSCSSRYARRPIAWTRATSPGRGPNVTRFTTWTTVRASGGGLVLSRKTGRGFEAHATVVQRARASTWTFGMTLLDRHWTEKVKSSEAPPGCVVPEHRLLFRVRWQVA